MSRRLRARLVALASAIVVLGCVAIALARPGGGDSYGGGDNGGGGGGGDGGGGGGGDGGGGAIVYLLVRLAVDYPAIGIPLLVGFVVLMIWRSKNAGKRRGWTAGASPQRPFTAAGPPARRAAPPDFERLRARDPGFSQVLFEDFLYALYAATHQSRGGGRLGIMQPYFADGALARYGAIPGLAEVKGIIVGAMPFRGVDVDAAGSANVQVTFESNYVEVVGGREQTYYAREAWTLFRKAGVVSRPPERARNVACPKCGAPLQGSAGGPSPLGNGTCPYCQTRVNGGDFDWIVREVVIVAREQRPPQLTTDAPEIGTDWPTIVDPRARDQFRALCTQDPAFAWASFEARVKLIHKTLNEGWSARDWMAVRPFVTDNLFQMQMYWIDAYRTAHLRNVLERSRVAKVETAKIVVDRYFVAFTVRVFATGLDYVVDDRTKKIVRGSDSTERPFSEYWTLIRSVQARGAGRSDPACPRCGAPLKVNQAGSCEFCHATVTTGEFDWVLSRIEQDESYLG